MASRRFALLAGVLVALNLALFLAPQGLALRRAVVTKLFGAKLVRLEVIDSCGTGCTTDTRIDRGVITSVDPTQVTLTEADGRTQQIGLSTATRISGQGRLYTASSLAPGWRVLVTWAANGSASSVKVERRAAPSSGGSHGKGRSG